MKFFLLCLTFSIFSSSVNSQFKYQKVNQHPEYPGIRVTNEFYPPLRDTNWTPTQKGALTKRPHDTLNTTVYQWVGSWQKLQALPADIHFTVEGGDTTYQNPLLIGWRIRLTREIIPMKMVTSFTPDSVDFPSECMTEFLFDKTIGKISFCHPLVRGERLKIELY